MILDIQREELLISQLADLLKNDRHVAVGAASPIPGAAALLAREEAKTFDKRLRVTILHSNRYNNFTDGARELFDCAAQGRIDTFFLGGVQIDGKANINLVGTGEYPKIEKRFPGSFGSALMYFVVPQIILFREEHSPRTLVKKVDFISAPGVSEKGVVISDKFPDLRPLLEQDFNFLNRYCELATELLPLRYQNYTKERLQQFAEPMSTEDLTRLMNVDLFPDLEVQ